LVLKVAQISGVSAGKTVVGFPFSPADVTTVIFTSAPRATEAQIIIPSNQAKARFIILFLLADSSWPLVFCSSSRSCSHGPVVVLFGNVLITSPTICDESLALREIAAWLACSIHS